MNRILLLSIALLLALGNSTQSKADPGSINPPPPQPIGPPTPRPDEDEAMPQPLPYPTPGPVTPPYPGPQPVYSYGAIAYSYSTGLFGTSSGQRDRYMAEQMARANCHAYDCNYVQWFMNSCMSLARSYNTGLYFAQGRTPEEAQSVAYWSCQRTYGNCGLVTTACSY